MIPLARSLERLVEQHFATALRQASNDPARPLLVGPPFNVSRALFETLTNNGQRDWTVVVNGTSFDIAVLLIDVAAPGGPGVQGVLATTCHWDYAVTIRNSRPRVLILADPNAWDQRPESLVNTTETVGSPRCDLSPNDALWQHVVREVSSTRLVNEVTVKATLEEVFKQAGNLEPASRENEIWSVTNGLIDAAPQGVDALDGLCCTVGAPALGGLAFPDSIKVLHRLAAFLEEAGFADGFDKLKSTNVANAQQLADDLNALRDWLSSRATSSAAFANTPSRFFRPEPGLPLPQWFFRLNAAVLVQLLDELQQGARQQKLRLLCENADVATGAIPSCPCIVASEPRLKVMAPRGGYLGSPTFLRRVGRAAPDTLQSDPTDPTRCSDSGAPPHTKAIKYIAEASNYAPANLDVIVLQSFSLGGLAIIRDALRCPPPAARPAGQAWVQTVELSRGGATDIVIYHAGAAVAVQVLRDSISLQRKETVPAQPFTSFILDVEHDDKLTVRLFNSDNVTIGEWEIQVAVVEATELSRSRFESLLREHRTGSSSVVRPPDSVVSRLELSSYLPATMSWKPVFACWHDEISGYPQIDWNNPRIGNVSPQIDPRPQFTPPASLLNARDEVREFLRNKGRAICEIELNDPALEPLIERYVSQYLEWMVLEPVGACWFDVIAVHSAEWNSQAVHHVPSEEPVLALLSPLHPLRLAWHAVAQKQLHESLANRCPAAGLIDPSTCPDAGVLAIRNGNNNVHRTLFSLACEDPHWGVMLNTTYLNREDSRRDALVRLNEMGLFVQGITSGFTADQTFDSIREVSRLLPARATMRIGLVGNMETSHACATGVIDWANERFGEEENASFGCLSVEVFDARGRNTPSPEELANLSESTDERAKWYRLLEPTVSPRLDLTIIDQLGASAPGGSPGTSRSPIGPAALYRVRVREDFQNALTLSESRIGTTTAVGAALSSLLSRALVAYEQMASRDADKSHFTFRPNQDAIGRRLETSTFLSVTSSQIDPACIVRGAVGQGGFLWDYELPDVLGGNESNLGYYLVARPTDAMRRAIERSAAIVTNSPPDAYALLDEISRHGIPVLKRLAGGGSQSRGELGLLLAVRLIQDAFRGGNSTPRLPVWDGQCIHLVLPVDPYEELFDEIRIRLSSITDSATRPDLLVVAIDLGSRSVPVAIKLTPVEVKFRGQTVMPRSEMRDALAQANNLGEIASAIWTSGLPTALWETCSFALLAHLLDFGFRIYASTAVHKHTDAEWTAVHQRVLQEILDRRANISVNRSGRLVVFDASPSSVTADLDNDTRLDTAVISLEDARILLDGTGNLSSTADNSVRALDFSFPTCTCSQTHISPIASVSSTTSVAPVSPNTPPPVLSDSCADTLPALQTVLDSTPRLASNTNNGERLSGEEISQRGGRISTELRQRVRQAFIGFIGNEPAVTRLTNDILRALIERPPHLAKNYLFTGLPSTGKTELARRMSVALDLPFVKLDGRGVTSRDRLFEMINGELQHCNAVPSQVGHQMGLDVLDYPPLIVFIDEVHLVPRSLQEGLLTMLETADRTVVLSDHVARVQKATFLFATTRASDVDAAFVSRCDEIQLREYTQSQVAEIVSAKMSNEWPNEIYAVIAQLGRCVPRVAIQLARDLDTAITVAEHERNLVEHLNEVRKAREIDERGLNRMDLDYLNLLERANRPIGEQVVLNMMRTVDKERVLNEVEPFLVRLGLIRHGPQGREITQQGREYVLARRVDE